LLVGVLLVSGCTPAIHVEDDGEGGGGGTAVSTSSGDYTDEYLESCEGFCSAWGQHAAVIGCSRDKAQCLDECREIPLDNPCRHENADIRRCFLAGTECVVECTTAAGALTVCEADHGVD